MASPAMKTMGRMDSTVLYATYSTKSCGDEEPAAGLSYVNHNGVHRGLMYNLQTAKTEIDQVASHATALTEYVISLSERVHAQDGAQETKLDHIKNEIMQAIEARFAELERKIFGDHAPEHTSFVADLGSKISALPHVPSATSHDAQTSELSHDSHAAYQHG